MSELSKSSYDYWLEAEGLPVHREVAGFDDITALPRKAWDRIGGNAAFMELVGTREANRGMYVGEIPPGQALKPEKHLYEKAIYIIQGRGFTEVWQGEGPKQKFEWGTGSLFAIPLNASHRMVNGSNEPVLFYANTTAPMIMNAFGENDFEVVFDSDYKFNGRWSGQKDYFAAADKRVKPDRGAVRLYTNFIPDVRSLFLNEFNEKVADGIQTGYRMGRFPAGHVSQWPVGHYHTAHYHGPGATIIGLSGDGYVLVWPSSIGARPYEAGQGDKVLKVKWRKNSLYCPPDRWYHQHFNTSKEPARHVAFYGNLTMQYAATTPLNEGGTLVPYDEEDPEIRRQFEHDLRANGIECSMPEIKPKTAATVRR